MKSKAVCYVLYHTASLIHSHVISLMPTVLLLFLPQLHWPLFFFFNSSVFLGCLSSLRVCLVTSAWKSFTLIRASQASSISSSLHHCHLIKEAFLTSCITQCSPPSVSSLSYFSPKHLSINGSFMYFSVFSLDLRFVWESAFLSSLFWVSRSILDIQWSFIEMSWIIKDICKYKYQKSCSVTFKIILLWVYSAYLRSY